MNLPKKIYIGTRKSEFPGDVITTVDKSYPGAKEYISKDAILEYIREEMSIPYGGEPSYWNEGYAFAGKKLEEKIAEL